MAAPTNSLVRRIFRIEPGVSVGQAILDKLVDKWDVVLIALVGGGGMSALARATAWVNQYGPIAWGAAFWLGVFLFLAARVIWATIKMKTTLSEYARKKSEFSGVNVLASTHEDERIDLSEFYHPFLRATEHVRFENCELMGPATLLLSGCTITNCEINQSDVVIVRQDRPLATATKFNFATFNRCRFYRVTFLWPFNHYQNNWPDNLKTVTPVISDGRVGDV